MHATLQPPHNLQGKVSNTIQVTSLHRALMATFKKLSKLGPGGKPKNVISADLFVAVVSKPAYAVERAILSFYHMSGAVDSAMDPADQIFHLYESVGVVLEPLIGTRIRAVYEVFKDTLCYVHDIYKKNSLRPGRPPGLALAPILYHSILVDIALYYIVVYSVMLYYNVIYYIIL